MDAYAVVETGGKQYRVTVKDILKVERLKAEEGAAFELQPVLAASDGSKLQIGKPVLAGAVVASKVVKHIRGEKTISFKKNRRKGYARKKGHRQDLTVLEITAIKAGA